MKFSVSIPGKRLRKETRSSLVKIGKEVAALSEVIMGILSTSGYIYTDTEAGKTFEIKVSRTAAKAAEEGEEL